MGFWKFRTPVQFIASCIWNLSEYLNIPIGKYDAEIFHLMIGRKNKRTK